MEKLRGREREETTEKKAECEMEEEEGEEQEEVRRRGNQIDDCVRDSYHITNPLSLYYH